MIKSLHLTNFRRHTDLDLRFDDDKQLLLIAGGNGVGKSTILEAIQFALWGESRHGRRDLDALVTRGAELEGMSVEMVFTIGSDTYRVHRRRDGKASTALLAVNDMDLVSGAREVTEEIGKLMGMDSAGFRLAVVAQQKDLDGLASLRPADRAQMVTRLLRLDALTAAKVQAGAQFRAERDRAVTLRGVEPVELEQEAATAAHELEQAQEELARSQSSLTLLDAELAATADVESAWQASSQAIARIDGALAQVREALAGRRAELARVTVPEASTAEQVDMAHLSSQLADVEREIAVGEQASRTAAQRQAVLAELDIARARLVALEPQMTATAPDVAEAELRHAELTEAARALEAELHSLQSSVGRAEASVMQAAERLRRSEAQEGTCSECGQEVSAGHRATQVAECTAELSAARAQLDALAAQLSVGRATLDARRAEAAQQADVVSGARAAVAALDRVHAEVQELTRRVSTYTAQVERLPDVAVDMDALYARKAQLSLAMTSANEAAANERLRAAALARREALREDIDTLDGQLTAKTAERAQAAPSADLTARHEARLFALENRRAEAELTQYWSTQVAVAQERVAAAARRAEENRERIERQAAHQKAAVDAAAAARLLGDVADRLATQIRPSLEGAVGSLLATMSSGRFAAVRIDHDYEITVEDDGKFRPLGELSGGEVDLVALATRLALAQVVSDRHGAGGAGFLILDECFGSQDPQRRSAILEGLRNLRDTYSQIFLISHVENIEDSADVVVSVRASEDRTETEVVVS